MSRAKLVCKFIQVNRILCFVYGVLVLVTGGSAGIGKMMATGFAQNGANVYIASRKEKQLQEARPSLP